MPSIEPAPPTQRVLRRYHGSVERKPLRVGLDAGRISEEAIQHLSALPRATVTLTLEIEADVPEGLPEDIARIVTENGAALKFGYQEFEEF